MTIHAQAVTSELVNLRDLGGIPLVGGAVRSGLLWRSDDVSRTTVDQAARLAGDGLTLVVDLRSAGEVAESGRGHLASHDVNYLSVPLLSSPSAPDQLTALLAEVSTPAQMGEWYAGMLVRTAESLVRGLEAISRTSGATLFHCAAGKDRTGVFAAAVLSTLEARHDDISADYALTGAALPAIFERLSEGRALGSALGLTVDSPLMSASAETMDAMLGFVDEHHGGVLAVLKDAGLTDRTISALRARLVVVPSGP